MKLFVFENIIGNHCMGDYYFIANTKSEAVTMADVYAREHNMRVKLDDMYIIEWDNENIKEYSIDPGFLSVNRMPVMMKI